MQCYDAFLTSIQDYSDVIRFHQHHQRLIGQCVHAGLKEEMKEKS